MPNIKNTNAVVINNNIKGQDELKILSKLSKMGLLKSHKKRAPRMTPQMLPMGPAIGSMPPIGMNRLQSQEAINQAAVEDIVRRTNSDLSNDVRFTNQGSQDIPKDSAAATVDVAPEGPTGFAPEVTDNIVVQPQDQELKVENIVRDQEQEVPEQRPDMLPDLGSLSLTDNQPTKEYPRMDRKEALPIIIKHRQRVLDKEKKQLEDALGMTIKEAIKNKLVTKQADDTLVSNIESPSKELTSVLKRYNRSRPTETTLINRLREQKYLENQSESEGFSKTVSQARPQGAREAVSFSQLRQPETAFVQSDSQSGLFA